MTAEEKNPKAADEKKAATKKAAAGKPAAGANWLNINFSLLISIYSDCHNFVPFQMAVVSFQKGVFRTKC